MTFVSDSIEKFQHLIRTIDKGTTLIEEGKEANALYIIIKGKFEVRSGKEVLGAIDYPGEYLGEIAFFLNKKYNATCIAATSAKVIEIPKDKIIDFLKGSPNVLTLLSKKLARKFMLITREFTRFLDEQNIKDGFTSLENKKDQDIMSNLVEMELQHPDIKKMYSKVDVGEKIIRINSPAEALYILISGEVRIDISDRHISTVNGFGEYFGEISFLTNRPAIATCTVTQPSIFVKIPKDNIDHFITRIPSTMIQITRSIAKRVDSINKQRLQILSKHTVANDPDYSAFVPSVFRTLQKIKEATTEDVTNLLGMPTSKLSTPNEAANEYWYFKKDGYIISVGISGDQITFTDIETDDMV